jgi:thiosulfate/3-mercaptopyruvate sulfurtransferase
VQGVASGNYKGYPDPSHIVSVEEALKLQKDGDVVFVDTRNYWKYVEGHIPGAVNLELYAFHWFDTSSEGLETFAREMAQLFGAHGIDNRKQVIFYQNDSGYDSARGVWLLEFLGNRNGRMLDGGLDLWRTNKGKVSKKDPEVTRASFVPEVDRGVVAGVDELSGRVGESGLTIIDARSRGEYNGTYRRALKAGHIPGASNIEWTRAMRKDGTLKDAKQLMALYGGLSPQGEVVTYCQSGYRAAHSWLVLRLLGFENARNYLGSWYEWGNHPTTRVER